MILPKITWLRKLLNTEIPTWNINASIDDITTTIEQEQKLSGAVLKNDRAVIFYKEVATTLVLMDGEPA